MISLREDVMEVMAGEHIDEIPLPPEPKSRSCSLQVQPAG